MATRGYSQERYLQSHTATPPAVRKAASHGFSYLAVPNAGPTPSQSLGYDGYSSLPRLRNGDRRKVVNNALQDYLKSLNSMTRSIVLESESVEKEHQCEWTDMNNAKKEEVMDRHFVPDDVRMHYEFERAESCCSFTTGWNSQLEPVSSGYVMENQPLHLSQPNEWEEVPRYQAEGHNRQLSRSNNDLMFRNHDTAEDLSHSQPSVNYPSYKYNSGSAGPQPAFNRLHKRQLSLRNSHKVNHHHSSSSRPSGPPPTAAMRRGHPRDSLGSDGEGTRTSDEDFFDNRNRNESPLAFQRNRLRSYSMRSKKNTRLGDSNSNPVRGSVRLNHRIQRPTSPATNNGSSEPSRPSHYHSYSNTSNETDFDEEIDLPIQSLLLDHVYTDSDSTSTPPQPVPPTRYSRQRRSLRKYEQKPTTVIHNTSSSDDNYTDSTDGGVPHMRFDPNGESKIIHNQILVRVGSHDSLDSVSTNPGSVTSKSILQSDDDTLSISEQSRMTPDSMLSSASCTSRPKSKTAEMAIMRNRRGKRGGSSYRRVTSDFAERHTQFKSNMFVRKQLDSAQSSATTTRATTPNDISSDTDYLKPTSLPLTKVNSVAESITSDCPRSPDHLSQVSTPPHTAPSKSLKYYNENRESGYLSSSSESFHVAARR